MIDRNKLAQIRKDLVPVLEKFAKEHGLEFSDEMRIGFTSTSFEIKGVKFVETADGMSAEQAMFEQECKAYGFVKEDYNKVYTIDGRKMAHTGFVNSSRKFPYEVTEVGTGKKYKVRYTAIPQTHNPFEGMKIEVVDLSTKK